MTRKLRAVEMRARGVEEKTDFKREELSECVRIRDKRNFEKFLFEAVDEGLSSLGESAKQAVYYYLEKVFNLNKQEIPYRVKDFEIAIEKIFGLGANFLETLILNQLYKKVGGNFKLPASKDLNFAEFVERAQLSKVS